MDGVLVVDALVPVLAVALLAPLVVGLLPRLPVPQVVLLLAGGILIGPEVLGLSSPSGVQVLADVGLGFVFLLAGYEVDLRLFREDAGRRAVVAWTVSVVLALGVVALLATAGLVQAFVPVALGLTTTALGTLLPVLRENGLLSGRLGRYLLAAGGVGELFPVLAIALLLGAQNRFTALASLGAVAVLAVLLALARRAVRDGGRLATVVLLGQHETAQITLRATILLLITLIAVTDEFHLDAVLGAFLAGVVLRRWAAGASPVLESKLDAVGYGFFIPVFFVYSGMSLDLHSIAEAPLRVALFLALMLAVRGAPALLVYRGVLTWRQRSQTALVTATALPVLVALAEIGVRNGTMLRENAAALVGAGVLTVLVFPALAVAFGRPAPAPAGSSARRPGRPAEQAPLEGTGDQQQEEPEVVDRRDEHPQDEGHDDGRRRDQARHGRRRARP
ncbi:Kef-type K+ transport system membrane component KefB [Geodermatophilus sabuli]|uniref:Transporter, CPA2 family n=1 Tax=Geodermatophilus sabuli TaxID=1564158 RepID=A0A285EHB7_9ACTN|nr:cation:proton antiporter [Geodermatophilus sabuli]MBB3083881.1 Kef-type K+ transport system membrane component KefB [Geodermatophilus sabuli]SNX98532.1 transporter, CPA2 family [Geodermatophilus sabuli]